MIVEWKPPPNDWLKVNTDGAARGKPGPAGYGGVFRNQNGEALGIFSINAGIGESNEMETKAIHYALQMYIDSELGTAYNLEVESDSQVALLWIEDSQSRPYRLWFILNSIDVMLENLRRHIRVTFRHVYRKANVFADELAKGGINRETDPATWDLG